MIDDIRAILAETAGLNSPAEEIDPRADLYDAGMTSHASVNVMLALEDRFDVEFPDRLLTRSTLASIESIGAALTDLGVADREAVAE